MLRAILFDLDGTLADTEKQNAESVARVLAARGRALTPAEREFVVGHGWQEIYRLLTKNGGVDLGFAELMRAAGEERERIVAEEGLDVLPGALDLVGRACARYLCTVVSGSSRREVAMCLGALGLADRFPFFIGAEDAARGKPFPDGYLLAAERLGVAPSECLAIEDSTAGIRAAQAAGMPCIAVRAGNFAGQPQEEAELVVDTLLEVTDGLLARFADGAYAKRRA